MFARALFVVLTLCLGGSALADPDLLRYPEDLAWQLLSRGDVREVTRCRDRLSREEQQGAPLLRLDPQPLAGIAPAPNSGKFAFDDKTQWELPPWPQLTPALPADMPPQVREQLLAEAEVSTPAVWEELMPYRVAAASVLFRPRQAAPGEDLVPEELVIPEPFSLRRYFGTQGQLVHVATYGGALGFRAENAFRALKAATPDRERLEGIGREAFLARIPHPAHGADREAERPAAEPTPMEPAEEKIDAVPFAEIEAFGPARPDLVDPGLSAARDAPVWQTIPVAIEAEPEDKPPSQELLNKKYVAKEAPAEHKLLLLVAHFEEHAVTLEIALDERLGTPQHLVELGLKAQERLLRNW